MKKIHRYFCIPFIIMCLCSVILMWNLSCMANITDYGLSMIISTLAFITTLVGIFTDSTYIIRERMPKKRKVNEEIYKYN